jgi:hypothetical protein
MGTGGGDDDSDDDPMGRIPMPGQPLQPVESNTREVSISAGQ